MGVGIKLPHIFPATGTEVGTIIGVEIAILDNSALLVLLFDGVLTPKEEGGCTGPLTETVLPVPIL